MIIEVSAIFSRAARLLMNRGILGHIALGEFGHRRHGPFARALSEGRTEVRASEAGGDEVTALARTFNRMADDPRGGGTAQGSNDR